jgi:hypothetical protein
MIGTESWSRTWHPGHVVWLSWITLRWIQSQWIDPNRMWRLDPTGLIERTATARVAKIGLERSVMARIALNNLDRTGSNRKSTQTHWTASFWSDDSSETCWAYWLLLNIRNVTFFWLEGVVTSRLSAHAGVIANWSCGAVSPQWSELNKNKGGRFLWLALTKTTTILGPFVVQPQRWCDSPSHTVR